MKFTQRLGYFFSGLAIGLIFLAVFLRKKQDATDTEFCYLPNCRVLKELRSHPIEYSSRARVELEKAGIDSTIFTKILEDGDVDFKSSEPRAKPCKIFNVDYTQKPRLLTAKFKLCDSILIAESIKVIKP